MSGMSPMRKVLLAASLVASFILGNVAAQWRLESRIEETQKALAVVSETIEQQNLQSANTRAFNEIESSIDSIGFVVRLEKRSAPTHYVREEFIGRLRRDIEALQKIKPNVQHQKGTEKIERLIAEAEDLILDIEIAYP